jgi:RimJ/RimL family protein N-acetyltransferase
MVRGPQSRSQAPPGVEVVDAPAGLRDLLSNADLVVTAAGQTMLEALACGAPTVALVRVENQRAQAALVERTGAACVSEESGLATRIRTLSQAIDSRRELATRGPAAVDGLGAHRVADILLSSLYGSDGFPCFGIDLRAAETGDRDFLLELRNDRSAYPMYGTPRPVDADEHREWLARSLAAEGLELLVIEREGARCGQLRLDRVNDAHGPALWEMSISISRVARGRGLGRRAILAGALLAWVRHRAGPIRASVHPRNEASLHAFQASGFTPNGHDGDGFERLLLERRRFDWSGPTS